MSTATIEPEVISPLDLDEARDLARDIKANLEFASEQITRFYDGSGWVPLGYRNWGECCQTEFGVTKAWANRMIKALPIQKELTNWHASVPPPTITQASELAVLKDAEARAQVWEAVQDKDGGPSTLDVRQAVRAHQAEQVIIETKQQPNGHYEAVTRKVYDSAEMAELNTRQREETRLRNHAKNLFAPLMTVIDQAYHVGKLDPQQAYLAWGHLSPERTRSLSSELRRLADLFTRLADAVEPYETTKLVVVDTQPARRMS
jgi:hypothetical protein